MRLVECRCWCVGVALALRLVLRRSWCSRRCPADGGCGLSPSTRGKGGSSRRGAHGRLLLVVRGRSCRRVVGLAFPRPLLFEEPEPRHLGLRRAS